MNHLFPVLFSTLIILVSGIRSEAQDQNQELVQFTGIIITADSLSAVPFAKIFVKTTRQGTTSDVMGYFSFVAHMGDTILFNALGYKPASFIIPDTIRHQRYSLIQLMTADTQEVGEGLCSTTGWRRRPSATGKRVVWTS